MNNNDRPKRFYNDPAFQFPYVNALKQFSGVHAHPTAVIAELVDNARDAGARQVTIEVSPDVIRITDDGNGMVPWITDADHIEIEKFLASLDGVNEPVNIRSIITNVSMKSLEWMAVNAAFSGKPEIDSSQRGEKGVGAQSARSLGDNIVFRTRPSSALALAYWGKGDKAKNTPIVEYFTPTREQLARYEVNPNIRFSDGPLQDRSGRELIQGTQITITDLKDGITQALRPTLLRDQLHVRFGNDVRRGMRIIVIDNLTDEGRRRGGIQMAVKAASYTGSPLYNGEIVLRDGQIVCNAEIYYAPGKNALGVTIRRKGSDIVELTSLPEFKEQPFTAGNLIGFIEYPDVSEAEWDSKKTEPLMGPLRKEWTRAIKSIVPEIREKIEALESRSKNAQLTEVNRQVSEAMIEALAQIEDFNPISIQGGKPERKRQDPYRKNPKPNPDYVQNRLIVRVEDEYRRPLEDVEVIATSVEMQSRLATPATGQVSFGKGLRGSYHVSVIVPEGMESHDGLTEQSVTLTESVPGSRLIFRLRTGEPGPNPLNIRSITIVLMENLGVIYSAKHLPYSSQIHIDPDLGEYGAASKADNLDRIAELTALYVACAIVEVAYNHDQPKTLPAEYQLLKAAELASLALRVFRERFGRKRK